MLSVPAPKANRFVRTLNSDLKDPWARRVLRYDDQRPELLLMAVCCLQLTLNTTPDPERRMAQLTLRNLVSFDCGFFHFCREWCRIYSEDEEDDTKELRQSLLEELFIMMPMSCQQLAKLKKLPSRTTTVHGCWSAGCRPKPAGGLTGIQAAAAF